MKGINYSCGFLIKLHLANLFLSVTILHSSIKRYYSFSTFSIVKLYQLDIFPLYSLYKIAFLKMYYFFKLHNNPTSVSLLQNIAQSLSYISFRLCELELIKLPWILAAKLLYYSKHSFVRPTVRNGGNVNFLAAIPDIAALLF